MDTSNENDVKNDNYANMDLRTVAEKRRDQRNSRIIETYQLIRDQNPDAKLSRIYPIVAEIVGDISVQTVRNVVKNI